MTSAKVRILVKAIFKLDSEFDAFVIDHFPDTSRAIAVGLDFEAKINLLFRKVGHERVFDILDDIKKDEVAAHSYIFEYSARSTPLYPDQRAHDLGERLMALYQHRADFLIKDNLGTVNNINEEILSIQREMRKEPTLQEGDFLADGKYQLLSKLGHGGFATVWKADDWAKQRIVAIKILHAQWISEQSHKDRFYQGSYKMWQMQHPSIVRVFSTAAEDSQTKTHYFAMQYINGGDLRSAILSKQLKQRQMISIICQIGRALEYAHSRNVIHRDIKPANILLDEEKNPFLTDFDLVWNAELTGGTRTNLGIGTLFYAAPEVMVNAKEPCFQSDVYSLAMTMAFCFFGEDLPIEAIRSTVEFVHRLSCSHSTKVILLRALSWNPSNRYSSMEEFVNALSRQETEPETRTASPRTSIGERTYIAYDMIKRNRIEQVELPLHILILADLLNGDRLPVSGLGEREFIDCSGSGFYNALRRLKPTIRFSARNLLNTDDTQEISIRITVHSMEDFSPQSLVKNIPELNRWYELRSAIAFLGVNFTGPSAGDNDYEQWFWTVAFSRIRHGVELSKQSNEGLIREIEERGCFPQHAHNMIIEGLFCLTIGIKIIDKVISSGCQSTNRIILHIDEMISRQLDAIIHAPQFLSVESNWRSIHLLANYATPESGIKITLLHCTKQEIIDDFNENSSVSTTEMYRYIHSSEFGTFGGKPYSMVVTNIHFDNTPDDILAIDGISQICANSFAILLCNVNINWFAVKTCKEVSDVSIDDYLQSMIFKNWRTIRTKDYSRFLVMTIGKFLLRLPYSPPDKPKEDLIVSYREEVTSLEHLLLGHGAFALAAWILASYQKTAWFPRLLTGTDGVAYPLQQDSTTLKLDTVDIFKESLIPERASGKLAQNGFLPILFSEERSAYQIRYDNNVFHSNDPEIENRLLVPERAESSLFYRNSAFCHFLYMLIYCRLNHYIKAISRESFRPFLDAEQEIGILQETLNEWLKKYVSDMKDPDPGIFRQRPVRFARAQVKLAAAVNNRPQSVIELTVIPHPLLDDSIEQHNQV